MEDQRGRKVQKDLCVANGSVEIQDERNTEIVIQTASSSRSQVFGDGAFDGKWEIEMRALDSKCTEQTTRLIEYVLSPVMEHVKENGREEMRGSIFGVIHSFRRRVRSSASLYPTRLLTVLRISTLIMLPLISSCASAQEPPAANSGSTTTDIKSAEVEDESPEYHLRIAWALGCGAERSADLFALEIAEDGRLRFHGGDEVRTKGTDIDSVSASAARDVIRSAREAEEVARRGLDSETLSQTMYCLRLKAGSSPEIEVPVSFDDYQRGGLKLERYIRTRMPLVQWLCPMRADEVIDTSYCPADEIRLSFIDHPDCGYAHVVHIDVTGAVHYFIASVPGSDQYTTTSRSAVGKLKKFASTFQEELVATSAGPGVTARPGSSKYRFYIGSADIAKFSRELQTLTKLHWHGSLPAKACPPDISDYPHGTVSIRQ